MRDKIKAAIIGCGTIFGVHADAIAKNENTELVCVVDIDAKKAKEAANRYNCKYYADYIQMLDIEDIDVVHICTPHYLHAPMAIEAMKKGKHVLTEKPIAISVDDAHEMIKVSGETEKILGICFQNRYNETSLKIKEVLESGKVGKVIGIKGLVTWNRSREYYTKSNWKGTWEKEGGGVLINQAIHTLDLLQWFAGEIDSLKAQVDISLLEGIIEVEDTAHAAIKFNNGAIGIFYSTNCYPADSPVEIEIICEEATIKLCGELTINYGNGKVETINEIDKKTGYKSYWGCSHERLINDYYEKIINGDKFPISGEEAIKSIKIINSIYKSSETGMFEKI